MILQLHKKCGAYLLYVYSRCNKRNYIKVKIRNWIRHCIEREFIENAGPNKLSMHNANTIKWLWNVDYCIVLSVISVDAVGWTIGMVKSDWTKNSISVTNSQNRLKKSLRLNYFFNLCFVISLSVSEICRYS